MSTFVRRYKVFVWMVMMMMMMDDTLENTFVHYSKGHQPRQDKGSLVGGVHLSSAGHPPKLLLLPTLWQTIFPSFSRCAPSR